jgi:hypothetical protein
MRPKSLSLILLFLLLATAAVSQPTATTNVTVTAHEYYDYYAQPAARWQKVVLLKIEGRNSAGNTQVYQSGCETSFQATLPSVTANSQYWVTVEWQGGERTYQSFVASSQRETSLNIYNP